MREMREAAEVDPRTIEVSKTIDGIPFTVYKLTGWRSLRMGHRVGRLLTPAISELAKAFDGMEEGGRIGDLEASVIVPVIGPALKNLFQSLTFDELESIAREVLATALYTDARSGRQAEVLPSFDLLFQGRMLTAYKVIGWAVWVNFGNFSDGAGDFQQLLGKLKGSASETSRPMSSSPGQPGDS